MIKRGYVMDIIGVIHLLPLPGSPKGVQLFTLIERAVSDAKALESAGVQKAIVENFGDAPFYKNNVPPHVVSFMTRVIQSIKAECSLELGVNVLRNDALSALAIASATDCSFIRVNVLSGAAWTDQGYIEGQAIETLLYRNRLGYNIAIMADVKVKHATPVGSSDIVQLARELVHRAGADQIILTGPETGRPCSINELQQLGGAFPGDQRPPIYLGSGVTPDNVNQYRELCTGAIVGTFFHRNSQISLPLDEQRICGFLQHLAE